MELSDLPAGWASHTALESHPVQYGIDTARSAAATTFKLGNVVSIQAGGAEGSIAADTTTGRQTESKLLQRRLTYKRKEKSATHNIGRTAICQEAIECGTKPQTRQQRAMWWRRCTENVRSASVARRTRQRCSPVGEASAYPSRKALSHLAHDDRIMSPKRL